MPLRTSLSKGIAGVTRLLEQVRDQLHGLRVSVGERIERIKSFWRSLTFSQHCYLVATTGCLLLFYTDMTISGTYGHLLALIALVGICVEFWPKFMRVWESLPGRALILIFYAIVANFALGDASGLVNDVTGVSAGAMPYSHNFALLLNMPGWFFVTSVMALLLLQLAMPFYLMLLLVLRVFGMHGLWHPPHYKYVITTALLRNGWSLVLLFQLFAFGNLTGIAGGDTLDVEVYNQINQELQDAIKAEEQSELVADSGDSQQQLDDMQGVKAGLNKVQDTMKEVKTRAEKYKLSQQQLLAWFIWAYEADSRSRCQLPAGSKVVELNDYEILEITELTEYDEDEQVGFNYRVVPCISPALGREFLPQGTEGE